MDWVNVRNKCESFLKKYRYVVLVAVIGIVLMTLPGKNTETETKQETQPETQSVQDPEEKLETVLSQIQGAGRVTVMLTIASGEETIYQTDRDQSTETDRESLQSDTVIITDSDRNESGLVTKVNSPVYQGAVVVCDGADDPTVRLAIVDAVSKATGLGADKISVLKMK